MRSNAILVKSFDFAVRVIQDVEELIRIITAIVKTASSAR